jgi:hypothetical protein
MKSLIKWKYIKAVNVWEGTVKGDSYYSITIEGGLAVVDLRESRKSVMYIPAKSYKIIGMTIEEAKQLAEDLVTGDNFEKHESNRMAWVAEEQSTMKLLSEVDELLELYK